MGLLDKLFGGGKGTSPLRQELQRQRQNTEKCLSILTRCQTRDQIIEGFGKIARLLKQANDPLADGAEKAAMGCGTLPDEYVLRLRDDFIQQCEAFLSAIEGEFGSL